ncbi:hypothetical protein GCM10007036_01030 [Alsobacter metallidurans]|uniref:Urease accessory protein n=1 Tax=Alsobacter metallidurans TaxID=340221 RepID=A0A917I3G5_9HYPH|nr:HupE/UreJ family protein [Alsobacter metallidurans]GGH06583.1 hypothetical protein GCM10007036_01030 [Alsobacter metallidurans]
MTRARLAAALVVAAVAATPALAHTGVDPHVHGFAMGFAHPLGGADHLLAMAAVGLWAGVIGGAARWAWPAAFMAAMAFAAVLGASGFTAPYAEAGVALSVAVLGGALAWGVRAPVAAGAALCAALATCHGLAHGAEMPTNAAGLAYGAGFLAATALLHGAGLILAAVAVGLSSRQSPRLAGAGLLAAGAAFLVG